MKLQAALYFPLFLLHSIPALAQPIDIGSHRELFVDRLLIERKSGVELKLHRPIKAPRPKSPLPEKHYITVIKDGDLYRAYWRGTDPDASQFRGRFPPSRNTFVRSSANLADILHSGCLFGLTKSPEWLLLDSCSIEGVAH